MNAASLPARIARAILPGRAALPAIAAGAANTLAFAPFDAWPLAILSPLALYLLLRGLDARAAAARGFAYGFGFWLAGVCWVYVSIHTYGYTPVPMAVTLTLLFAAFLSALFFAWWTALYGWLARGVLRPLLFVALWVLAEWVRTWLFTGFPWLCQGYAFIDTPLAGFAPVGGVLLLSALAVGIAVLAVDLVRGTRRAQAIAAVAIAALFAGGWALQRIDWTQPAGEPATVSLVQGNIPQDQKWLQEMQGPTLAIYGQLTRGEWGRDLIVWPESAVPLFMHEATDLIEEIRTRADASGSAFITGMPFAARLDDRYVFHNSVLSIGGPEKVVLYDKVHLVPFGEVVPFAEVLRAIAPFFALTGIPLEGFDRGADNQPPLPAGKLRLATYVCYEVVYPDYVRRQARAANVLLTVSNDAWFGASHGPAQHFQIARMRALETGRWMLRDTNTGITGIIDAKGRVAATMPAFERAVLRGSVTPMQGETPFMVAGQWPVVGGLLLLVALALRRARRPE